MTVLLAGAKASIAIVALKWPVNGGKSTGPQTAEGKARAAAAHTKHGRRSKAHVEKVRYINAEIRRITYELKRDGFIP
jgi:hypothetical protein